MPYLVRSDYPCLHGVDESTDTGSDDPQASGLRYSHCGCSTGRARRARARRARARRIGIVWKSAVDDKSVGAVDVGDTSDSRVDVRRGAIADDGGKVGIISLLVATTLRVLRADALNGQSGVCRVGVGLVLSSLGAVVEVVRVGVGVGICAVAVESVCSNTEGRTSKDERCDTCRRATAGSVGSGCTASVVVASSAV
jgi:hypothetical protein